jgi:hypothetical protein
MHQFTQTLPCKKEKATIVYLYNDVFKNNLDGDGCCDKFIDISTSDGHELDVIIINVIYF